MVQVREIGLRSPGDIHKLSFPAISEGSLMIIQASNGVMGIVPPPES